MKGKWLRMEKQSNGIFSKIYVGFLVAFFYIPFIPLILFSFNSGRSLTNWSGFSLRWYEKLSQDKDIALAIFNTFTVAIIATAISVLIGTLACIALSRSRKTLRDMILSINNIPIVNPEIVTAVALLLLFVSFGIEQGLITMILAHIAFCVPYVIITIYPKVKSLDPNVVEAGQDLGATPWQTFTKVLIPQIKPSIFAGAAIAFTMSFDDFIISFFTSGTVKNISIYLYTSKRRDPTINALSTIIIFVIISVVLINMVVKKRKRRKEEKGGI